MQFFISCTLYLYVNWIQAITTDAHVGGEVYMYIHIASSEALNYIRQDFDVPFPTLLSTSQQIAKVLQQAS